MTPDPARQENPPPPAAPAPFCDLILNGGIASGVAYPKAIALLAKRFRFHGLGGTSVGALAAATAAAAEYRRRQTGSNAGYDALAQLPEQLAQPGDGSLSALARLFVPEPGTRRLFDVLMAGLNKGAWQGAASAAVAHSVRAYYPAFLAAVLAGAALWVALAGAPLWSRVVAVLGTTLLLWLLMMALLLRHDLVHGLVANHYGICKLGGEAQALTPWLHQQLQGLSGKPTHTPLTFADLHNAAHGPPAVQSPLRSREPSRSIDLQMLTTNLTLGQPCLLPRREGADRLYFLPEELRPYFPMEVWLHLLDVAHPLADDRSTLLPPTRDDLHRLRLLPGAELPVVVAVRLSLSFPFLISAVPLHAEALVAPGEERRIVPCWMSDGGLGSNLPVHLFDRGLPRWPTFALWLVDLSPNGGPAQPGAAARAAWLPAQHDAGNGHYWNPIDPPNCKPLTRLGNFALALILTAKDWKDASLARMPGVRDRVARIGLYPGEGGLNLNMPPQAIAAVAERGERAAGLLTDRFAPSSPEAPAAGWAEQRWVRWQLQALGFRRQLRGISDAATNPAFGMPLAEQVAQAGVTPPLSSPTPYLLSEAERARLAVHLNSLKELEDLLGQMPEDPGPYAPSPDPHWRIQAPL